jgi:hypothetical protein
MERDPAAQAAVLVAAAAVPARDAVEAEAGEQDLGANAYVLSAAPRYRTSPVRPAPPYPARSAARP